MKRRAVLVSYHFPPTASAGVARVVAVVRALVRRGWDVEILTVRRAQREPEDPAWLRRVPGEVKVIRTPAVEWLRVYERIRLRRGGHPEREESGENPAVSNSPFWTRWKDAVLAAALFPDRHWGWGPFLVGSLWRRLRAGRAVVLSTSPPHSSQIAVAVLTRFLRFPWIADFRDPWSVPPYRHRRSLGAKLARRLEGWVLRRCDRVVANTPGNRRALLEAYPFLDEDRVVTIPNGADPEEWRELPEEVPSLEGDLLYTGELYEGMMDPYLAALRILSRSRPGDAPRLELFGPEDPELLDRIEREGLSDWIRWRGRVSRPVSFALMRRARALLLLLPWHTRGRTWVPSKTYQYLWAGPPVVLVGPSGDASRILEECGAGVLLDEIDPERLAERLAEVVGWIRRGRWPLERRPERIDRYRLDRSAERMVDLLESLEEER
jgi:glycosyltransferase involved in cell wall biosynthesis